LPRKGSAKGVRTQSGLICEDEEQEMRKKRSRKKMMAGQMKETNVQQTKKTNGVVLPTWKYWYRK
jgi:hypothetical protein